MPALAHPLGFAGGRGRCYCLAMSRTVLTLALCLCTGAALAGASVPKASDAVDEAALSQAAAAGSQVAELALLCGWEADTGLVLQAKTAALMLATQAIEPDKRRYETMTRILASNVMTGHARAARRQVGNGGCVDAAEKAKWTSLRKHTLTLLATPPPARPAVPAPASAPAASPPPSAPAPVPARPPRL